VLVCASGMSPAIITETLYALITRQLPSDPFVPDEIHIVTTTEGQVRIAKDLLQPGGPFEQLLDAYLPSGHARPRFDASTIHVISGQADVSSEHSNRLAGDCMFQTYLGIQNSSLLKRDAGRGAPYIHASIAGGRKTMSFLMGHVFSLLAGPNDELSHVLVNEPFEAVRPTFFFPPQQPVMHAYIPRATGGARAQGASRELEISSDQARIELGLITALKLGNQWMPSAWSDGSATQMGFELAVRLANAQHTPERITLMLAQSSVDLKTRSYVSVCGQEIDLGVSEFALLAMYALVKQNAQRCPGGEALDITALPTALWDLLPNEFGDNRKKFSAFSADKFKTSRTRLDAALQRHIGGAASHYLIAPIGDKAAGTHRPYQLVTHAHLIEFGGDSEYLGWDSEWWPILRRHLATHEGHAASNPGWVTPTPAA
jgi:CRISPR-associated protein (TIGR02584 family)